MRTIKISNYRYNFLKDIRREWLFVKKVTVERKLGNTHYMLNVSAAHLIKGWHREEILIYEVL
jgi:hypothetical protein